MRIKKTSQTATLPEVVTSYSTDEVRTGYTWIDGKPIYRKVFTGNIGTLTSTWTTIFTVSNSNIDTLLDIKGMIAGGKIPRYSTGDYYIDIQKAGNNIQVMGSGYGNQNYIVILEYTKTGGNS